MVVLYLQDAAGIKAGTMKPLPDTLAFELINMGICKAAGKPETSVSKSEVEQVAEPAKKRAKSSRK